MPKPTPEEIRYGGVLMFMHWAMNQPEGKTKPLGELLLVGCRACSLPYPGKEIEAAILTVAFRLASQEVPFTTVTA